MENEPPPPAPSKEEDFTKPGWRYVLLEVVFAAIIIAVFLAWGYHRHTASQEDPAPPPQQQDTTPTAQ